MSARPFSLANPSQLKDIYKCLALGFPQERQKGRDGCSAVSALQPIATSTSTHDDTTNTTCQSIQSSIIKDGRVGVAMALVPIKNEK